MADQDKALQVLVPEVRTLARPASGPLIAARGVIQRSPAIQAVFVQAKAEGWSEDRLADVLEGQLGASLEGTPAEVRQAALYLAAEHLQFGDALLLVSRETGRAIARVTDEDIWQPPMVPRESGGMAKPLPRLRPELEGFLYQCVHDHDREARLATDLAVRTQQTAFLAEEGDRRLLISTREGRRVIENEIRARGEQILEGTTGIVRDFLAYFSGEAGPDLMTSLTMARTRTEISDLVAVNYRFAHANGQYASLANEWAREIARTLGVEAHQRNPAKQVRYEDLATEHLQGATFWVADPEVSGAFNRIPGVSVLFVPGVRSFGFTANPVGLLRHEPGSLKVEGRDMLGHWDVMGRFAYTLSLDFTKIVTLEVSDVPVPTLVAELMR